MKLFKSGLHDSLIRLIGFYFFYQSGKIIFTEYVVLESMSLELIEELKKLKHRELEDYENIMKPKKS